MTDDSKFVNFRQLSNPHPDRRNFLTVFCKL